MKIVVTDGYTLNPGDLSWETIQALGDLKVYDRTAPAEIVERCVGAAIVLTNKVPFSKETLEALPDLKFIGVTATGYNIIDSKAAAAQGIVVSNVPGYGTDSVAQHVFSLLLELTNHVGKHAQSTAAGDWQRCADFAYTVAPIHELAGKTFGVVGWGNIGQKTAEIARAFGMNIIYHNHRPKPSQTGKQVSLETLFAESDIVSLHCPLTADNQQFVNAKLLHTMKRSALLINTARGQLINEQELADALNNGVIAGAGLDVLSKEPPVDGNPLLSAKNCLVTPHIAWISYEARVRVMSVTASNIKAFRKGSPENKVG
ncbi:MAG: D-2-hydroxyacid dehydrogenase [Bacteroidetes bacterium]|nr:D-2-hydroxyacid dehydrogenase [Bacteroidota bacterium]